MSKLLKSPSLNFIQYLWLNYRRYMASGLIVLTIGAFVDASSAFLVAPIFDLILNEQSHSQEYTSLTQNIFKIFKSLGISQTTTSALIVFLLIYILKSLLSVLAGWYESIIRASLIKGMTVNLFRSVVNANWKFFLNKNQGDFINSITRESQYLGFAYQALNNCIVAIFQMLTFGGIAFFVSGKLTAICVFVAFIFAIPMLIVSKLNYKWGKENVKSAALSNSITQESFSLAKVIQAFSCQENSIQKLDAQQDIQKRLGIRFFTIAKAMQEFYYPLGLVSVIAGYYFSKYYNIPFTELTVILYCLWKCVPYMSSFLRSKGQLGQYLPSFENIRDLEQEAQKHSLPSSGEKFLGLKDKLELNDVTFSYSDSSEPVIQKIKLTIQKGQMVALVGKSGAGKSTIADIIMGFHKVQSGHMSVDGKDFNDINVKSFREYLGYVPQQSVLFNDSIKNNLIWANNDATDDDIIDACKLANAYEFIAALPEKLDTVVGDRGIKLSGGQIQRIAIARAILRKPEILILDEATSALDSDSEQQIQKAIEQIAHSTTMVIIAHRLSTIKNADMVYVLGDRKLLESGSYEKLERNKKSIFSSMLQNQNILTKTA